MGFVYALIILIAIFGIIGIIYVFNYNSIQSKKLKVDEAEYMIDEALRIKFDLVIKIIDIIKKVTNIKADYFKDFESLKTKKISNFDLDRKITETLLTANQLKNDHEKLEESKELKAAFQELKNNDEKLEAAKSFYNKYIKELNQNIKKFPSNVVARLHGFNARPFFDGKNLDDEDVNDFKL